MEKELERKIFMLEEYKTKEIMEEQLSSEWTIRLKCNYYKIKLI